MLLTSFHFNAENIHTVHEVDQRMDSVRAMTHGAVFADSAADLAAESARSFIASDGIKQTQRRSPIDGRFADSACRLLAVQRAV
jgi:hypothetical protein